MSDEREWKVTILQPYVYRVLAEDEEHARRAGIQRWLDKAPADIGLFPCDVLVEEIKEVTARGEPTK